MPTPPPGKERPNLRPLLKVEPGKADLSAIDPRGTPGLPSAKLVLRDPKAWAKSEVETVGEALSDLQERLFAEGKNGANKRVLLLLQAMDCGGKDGTVRHVVGTMNPQGLRIVSFGVPTEEERKHNYLWRIRRALPTAGLIGVFNRSHYEDVLVVRVHDLVPSAVWSKRYDEINKFEAKEAESDLTIVKVMLHISREEQKKRLRERLDDPTKHWKYNPGDLAERAHWDEYQKAYEDALGRCSTDAAPWYVVPADRKWYRNWAVAHLLWDTLEDLDPRYPEPDYDVEEERRKLMAAP